MADEKREAESASTADEKRREGKGKSAVGDRHCETEGEGLTDACPCRHKSTPRSAKLQADMQKRLNRAIGQLNGVKAMIEDNRYCGDVLTQLAAAESAVRRVSEMVLAEHMRTCVVEEVRAGNDDVIDEVMALMRRFSK